MAEIVPPNPNQPESTPAAKFDQVWTTELEAIAVRRRALVAENLLKATAVKAVASEGELGTRAMQSDLCGLAISGGGIRSATFGLGVLQGLSQVGLLGRFDYLSTVSGGGYIGSWWSAWIRDEGFEAVTAKLNPNLKRDNAAQEPKPIRHLRYYSNYLAPQPGLFSYDGWTLVSIYLRNFLLNVTVLILAMLGVFVGIRGIVEAYSVVSGWPSDGWLVRIMGAGAVVVPALGFIGTSWSLKRHFGRSRRRSREYRLQFTIAAACIWLAAAVLGSLVVGSGFAGKWIASWTVRSILAAAILAVSVVCALPGCTRQDWWKPASARWR